MILRRIARSLVSLTLFAGMLCSAQPQHSAPSTNFDGSRALNYAAEFAGIGPRWSTSPGHARAEDFLKKQFAGEQAKGEFEADHFTPNTPAGPLPMTNYIVRFPGKKDGVIVLSSHYETNYPLRNIHFVGANDGASTTGELIELANLLRAKQVGGKLEGYSIWLVFFDGEEAVETWSPSDSLYGSRHLAAKWQSDGTLKRIKAFFVLDMIGDKDLNVLRDDNSTPWLLDVVKQAAAKTGNSKYFFATHNSVFDDHNPFHDRGVASADIIDLDFGPHDFSHPDGYHHTAEDTMDKISAHSLTVIGNTLLETLRLLNQG